MIRSLKTLITITAAFLILDGLWLGLLMTDFYKDALGSLARRSGPDFAPVVWAALVVYALLPLGTFLFVLPRAAGSVAGALGWGAVFGVIAYGVYDFTNYSTLNNWPAQVVAVDVAWGAIICGVSAAVATAAERRFS